jgi:alpha-glucosidase
VRCSRASRHLQSARAVATECVESPGRVLRACVSVDADGAPTSSPDHPTILPFTRMLSGPMDFTHGILDVTFGHAQINERVQSPENYRARPDAFRFIEDEPTDWETSRTLDAVIDAPGADSRTNPKSLAIESRIVGRGDRFTLALAPGGGQAVRFRRLAG